MKKSGIFYLGILLLMTGMNACQSEKTVFEQHQKMERMSWDRFNILEFEFPVEDVEKEYDFYLNIRHLPQVTYKKIEINFTLYTPSEDMRTTNLGLPFYDREGNSLSKCMGDLCDLELPLRKNFKFSEKGIARIEIENRFTKINMPGIMEVGLIVRESEKE